MRSNWIGKTIPISVAAVLAAAGVALAPALYEYHTYRQLEWPNQSVYERNVHLYAEEPVPDEYFLGQIEFVYEIDGQSDYWAAVSAYRVIVLRELDVENRAHMSWLADKILASHYQTLGEDKPADRDYSFTCTLSDPELVSGLNTAAFRIL